MNNNHTPADPLPFDFCWKKNLTNSKAKELHICDNHSVTFLTASATTRGSTYPDPRKILQRWEFSFDSCFPLLWVQFNIFPNSHLLTLNFSFPTSYFPLPSFQSLFSSSCYKGPSIKDVCQIFGILNPLPPLVHILVWSLELNPHNLPYYACFWASTPQVRLSFMNGPYMTS